MATLPSASQRRAAAPVTDILIVDFDPTSAPAPTEQEETIDESSALNPVAAIAFVLAGAAILAPAFRPTASTTPWLAGIALATAIAALFVEGGRLRLALSSAGLSVSSLTLLAALFIPSLLVPHYEATQQRSDYDPKALQVIPLQLANDSRALEFNGYADASRAAVQQGYIRVQVTSASVGPVRVVDSRRRLTKQPFLAIGLRIQHLGHAPSGRLIHWDTIGERSVRPATASMDGRNLSLANTGADVPVGVVYGQDLFPGRVVEDLLLFEAPPAHGDVRLELPAEAWGGQGAFRFQIPSSMILSQPAKKPR
ncbi:MAG TPA: hypothetical protein VLM40_23575 [Gemmata sp.]|nr:hypothetical protein [Gemmata sp.]